jgi:RNA polymerase sigma-70 factor (ECF subfamily)
MRVMSSVGVPDQGAALLAMYDRALPQVFGYLRSRVPNEAVAEDLTAETFLAAVQAIQRDGIPHLTVAWLVGVARYKLVDQWRVRELGGQVLSVADYESGGNAECIDDQGLRLDLFRPGY